MKTLRNMCNSKKTECCVIRDRCGVKDDLVIRTQRERFNKKNECLYYKATNVYSECVLKPGKR